MFLIKGGSCGMQQGRCCGMFRGIALAMVWETGWCLEYVNLYWKPGSLRDSADNYLGDFRALAADVDAVGRIGHGLTLEVEVFNGCVDIGISLYTFNAGDNAGGAYRNAGGVAMGHGLSLIHI